jgi:hypothetical protein
VSGPLSALDDPFEDVIDNHLGKTNWSLDDGVDLCRAIEAVVISKGYHIALGGSVLMQGSSKKDIDIFVYPHKKGGKKLISKAKLLKHLGLKLNLKVVRKTNFNEYDKKIVYICHINDQRIDLFFVK